MIATLRQSKNGYSAAVAPHMATAIIAKLDDYTARGVLSPARNQQAAAAFKGKAGVAKTWNVQIFNPRKNSPHRGFQTVSSNDLHTLINLLEDNEGLAVLKPGVPVVSIDDAGWGFPFGGVMIGVEQAGEITTAVANYDENICETYALRGLELLKARQLHPTNCQIQICTGHVNRALKDTLRKAGYHVVVAAIAGVLQDGLEGLYAKYIKDTYGFDWYYDPKQCAIREIPKFYHQAVAFAKMHGIPLKW